MKIKDLKPNAKNPRKISSARLKMLADSLKKYGDLGGIVFNRRTGRLVGAHQRTKVIPADAQIVIEKRYDQPTEARTVAEGYVLLNGERFKYREVDADEKWEMGALLAANKHGGEWDNEMLRIALTEVDPIDIETSGFEIQELYKLGIDLDLPSSDEIVSEPVVNEEGNEEESDEEYVANTPQTEERIPTESFNASASNANPFDAVEEKSTVDGKRFVIIIDCGTQEKKTSLKEKLLQIVTDAGASFF